MIKTGVSPVLIDLMQRGYVSALAMNGAGIIHDFEIALVGRDVGGRRRGARSGPLRHGGGDRPPAERGRSQRRATDRLGLGQAVGALSRRPTNPPHADRSLAVAAHRLGIPVTVHVALGTDIIHMHPAASGAAIGDTSLRDFRYFTSSVARLDGGVYLNCGSAVVLPEVFLKAVALARNPGRPLDGLTTVNIDFLRMYRPQTNVVDQAGGRHRRRRHLAGRPPRDPDSR